MFIDVSMSSLSCITFTPTKLEQYGILLLFGGCEGVSSATTRWALGVGRQIRCLLDAADDNWILMINGQPVSEEQSQERF
jgi:hypothetical protein